MDKWEGKVAVITGASEGCGAVIAVDLVKCGMIVVGLARRPEKINELRDKIPESATGQLHAIKCDIRNEDDIKSAFTWVEENLDGTDVLINNAAIIRPGFMLDEDNTEMIRSVIETNLIGVALCTREAFKSMKNKELGHVVMINSVSGHKVFYSVGAMPSFNVYAPSKHGMTALVEVLRQECQSLKTNVRISSISPGMIATGMLGPELCNALSGIPLLPPEEISAAVMYVLGTPPSVQIHELTIKPMGESF